MLDRDQLETFAVVIEQQSFEKAATALSITRGAVSQRIKALEESLSTVLVLRDRPVSPTPAGEVLLRYVKALRIMEGAALQELAPQPKPHALVPLSIAVNADSLATWFPEVLKELLLSQLVALEVVADDQDHTSQLLSRGEVIGCISTSAKAADGFVAECLGAMEYRCYATPEFAASAFPDGLTVPSVLAAPAVLFNRKDSLHDDFLKSRFGFSIDRYAKHFLPSPVALLEGVAMGAGYGLIPSTQAQHFVDSGRLIDLCPNHGVMVDLYWHHWELEPPLAHDVTSLIVNVAHRELVSRTAEESEVVVAGSGDSATRLRPVSPAVASNKAKADCNTH